MLFGNILGHCLSSNAKYVLFFFSFVDSKNPELYFLLLFVFGFLIYSLLYQDNLCQLQQSGKLSRDEIHWKTCRMGSCKHRLYHNENSVLEISVNYIQINSHSPKGHGLHRGKRQKRQGKEQSSFITQRQSVQLLKSSLTKGSKSQKENKC